MKFKNLDIIGGWIAFAIATFTYVSTMEPSVSFWDCGEFIACAYKLQVGHPPGAPLFLMIGRLFSMWTAPEQAAYMVNLISALSSSFTILFLFWTISALARKILNKTNPEWNLGKSIAIIGSAMVGSLAYTFSDTFWFSAVEAEVYAMSSLFTAIVFWAILRWERVSEDPGADRWLIFIAYLMGLSIGVHLLNLLAIPAIAFVFYFKKYKPSLKGVGLTAAASILLLGFVQKGVIPGLVTMSGKFELFFVNSLNFPFHTGAFIHIIILAAALVYAIYLTHQTDDKKWKMMVLLVIITLLTASFSKLGLISSAVIVGIFIMAKSIPSRAVNTGLLCLSVILIGYSSYTMILVRSNANPPMDENNPENMFSLLSYLNREQYGSQPIAYGQYFNTPLDNKTPYLDGNPTYFQAFDKEEYVKGTHHKKTQPNYASEFMTVFPRMWSQEARHIKAYKSWSNFKGKPIRYKSVGGKSETIYRPTFGENLTYFFAHQINWMYWRYFLWNFSGRQNDIQGHGEIVDGNWLSGINFIDSIFLGDQADLPPSIKNHKARNTFFLLPLILGLIGLFFQFNRSKRDFALVTMLFLFTGLAIIIYLNQYPYQPRERDYAYAGSFYAFTIWIGLGVLGIIDLLTTKVKLNQVIAGSLATVVCLASVPALMAKEGWNDHDRSNRYTALDFAKMYLDSCEENAVLFTNGDNDTFPLWYVQEVEGYRTDIRVINLSLLNTDWYIDQMSRAAYDSPPTPFSLKQDQYRQGTRDYIPVIDRNKSSNYIDVKKVVEFFSNNKNQATMGNNRKMNYSPTKLYSLPVDSAKVATNGTVCAEKTGDILPEIQWKLGKNYLLKKDLLMLDLLANFNWDRPIYFAITTGNDAYLGLQGHFQLEGLTYRLVPFKGKSQDGQTGYINTDIMYDNLMNKFKYGNVKDENVYVDHNILRMCMNLRNNFSRCADALVNKNEYEKAEKLLDKAVLEMPDSQVPFNYFMLPLIEIYFKIGKSEKAEKIAKTMLDRYVSELDYYLSLKPDMYKRLGSTAQQEIGVIYQINTILKKYNPNGELYKSNTEDFQRLEKQFTAKA